MKDTNHIILYIKFIKKKHLKNFLYKGEFHFGSIKYYRQLGQNNSIIGDNKEGTKHYIFKPGSTLTFEWDNKKIVHKLLPEELADIRKNVNDNAHIYCMSYITTKDLYQIDNNHYKIKQSVIDELQANFPQKTYTPIAICDVNNLRDKLFSYFNASTFSGNVMYYSKSNEDLALKTISNEFKNIMTEEAFKASKNTFYAFIKSDKYKSQRELRFLSVNGHDLDEHNNIYIGNIRNYVHNMGDLNKPTIAITNN